ncbi:MAG TPA: hypothetical protein PLM22_09405 [Candidatus Sabulitectum sp.]|nr:hypothetical protein [Candidatus Sabulitectum sp.]HPF32011.1 hypothetical protein [Candidatus Sabulitectum sp.]HPJ29137.1 hypothetical protein [Candidatus Sabulitectum sp.]HPR21597.1 hypothetical protein [Candidatus Sabulitectum sp.]
MPVRTKANPTALILFSAVIAAFLAGGFLVPSKLPSGESSPLPGFLFFMGGLFLAINLILLARAAVLNRKRAFIEANWLQATAKVTAISETGTYINRQPKVELRLLVDPPEGERFEARLIQVLPVTALSGFQPGSEVNVRVDPDDYSKVHLM